MGEGARPLFGFQGGSLHYNAHQTQAHDTYTDACTSCAWSTLSRDTSYL